MTELRIIRSGDIGLFVGDEQLYGVTDFYAKAVYGSYPIQEYLSGEPFAVVNPKKEYTIKMTVLSLFRYEILDGEGFSMSVVDGDIRYIYDNCAVISHERNIKAGKNVVDTFVIRAAGMRKQASENAG